MKEFFRKVLAWPRQSLPRNSTRQVVDEGNNSPRETDVSKLLVRAKKLERIDKPLDALRLLQQFAKEHHSNSELSHELALLQIKNGSIPEARDTYLSILRGNITDLNAIEGFLELNYTAPAPSGTVTEILTELCTSIPSNEEFDDEAAVFILPSMHLMVPADEAIRRLKYSQNATARYISALATSDIELTDEPSALDPSLKEAKIVVSLVRGDYAVAQKLLPDPPGAAGLRALKQAIQRELRAGRMGEASDLVAKFMLFKPDNEWVRRTHDQLTLGQKVRSRHQLTHEGFPFPELPVERDYKPSSRKILYLLHNSLPHDSAGYAIRTHGLISGLRARGWRVNGVTRLGYPARTDRDEKTNASPVLSNVIDGNKYYRLIDDRESATVEPFEEYIRRYSEALYELSLNEKPALIHAASNHWNGLAAVIVARRLGIPSIYEVRGLWEITEASRNPSWHDSGAFKFMQRMETDAAHAATRVLTITQALKDELVTRGVPAAKITVIPNAVDTSRFRPSKDTSDLLTRFGLESKTVIGYLGSLVDYEGIPLLIEAAAMLAQSRDDFKLLIVGDGPELPSLRHSVDTLGLDDKIIFAGAVSHDSISRYYDVIDVVALPRLALPVCEMVSPLKPFEAMASGKALVASNVAALSEIINHRETGLLHEKGSVASLRDNLELLLDSPDLRRTLGSNAAQWVKDNRTWSRVSGEAARVYETLLGTTPSEQDVLNEIVKLESTHAMTDRTPIERIFELGSRNLHTHLGRRLLVHSALNVRSSRYSLRVVELFAEYGLWNLVSYLARHALPSVKNENFAQALEKVLAQEHDLANIGSVRVSFLDLAKPSQLEAAVAELIIGSQAVTDESVLSPLFLIAQRRKKADGPLFHLARRICESLGIQLVVQHEPNVDNVTKSPTRSARQSSSPALEVATCDDHDFSFLESQSSYSPAFWRLGTLTKKEVMEVAAVHWLLNMQASPVLKLQRTKWRNSLVTSLSAILPLVTVPGAFRVAASALKHDPDAERYLQRASSALLRTGHYQGASETLSEISVEKQDSRYSNRLIEAAFGIADFERVIELKESIDWTPRMEKLLTESEAASRMIKRLQAATQGGAFSSKTKLAGRALRVVSILHASVPDQVGGYANRAHALLRSLTERGIEVRAYTRPGFPNYLLKRGQVENLTHEGVNYYRMGSEVRRETGEFAYMEASIDAYRAILEVEQPDVVHLRSTYVSALPGLIAARELSIPTLYEVSGMWELVYASYKDARREGLRARTVTMENEVLKHADRIVTLTEAMASEIKSRLVPRLPVTLVPNAVDVERFKPQPKRMDLKTSLGWQIDIPVIGYAGSLVDYEGLDILLRAAEILQRKGLEFKVLIIGDGAVKSDLERLSAKLGLEKTVRFTGRLPHHLVGEYYTIFDVCAFPRYLTHATRAVSPLKPFEALATAKPIVVSDIPALSEIVGKNRARPRGLTVEENNPLALSQALERLLTDAPLRETLAANGLIWVRENRSWDMISSLFASTVVETSSSVTSFVDQE